MMGMTLSRRYHFSAAHRLHSVHFSEEDNRKIYGPCMRDHGHNYYLWISVCGTISPETGVLMDVRALDALVKHHVLSKVDHYTLNAAQLGVLSPAGGADPGWIATTENLVLLIQSWLRPVLPSGVSLERVRLYESAANSCELPESPARC